MIISALRPTVIFLGLFTIIFGFIYPAVSTVTMQTLFPQEAQGSLIYYKDGKVIGSELIGQNFTEPKYFWGRLSATAPVYNAAASSGSNFGANNPALLDAVKTRSEMLGGKNIPVDLVTASGSGLDPQISPEAAEFQVERVAKARGKKPEEIREYINKFTEGRQFGILGEARVNVLKLNLALDGKI